MFTSLIQNQNTECFGLARELLSLIPVCEQTNQLTIAIILNIAVMYSMWLVVKPFCTSCKVLNTSASGGMTKQILMNWKKGIIKSTLVSSKWYSTLKFYSLNI